MEVLRLRIKKVLQVLYYFYASKKMMEKLKFH
ncbi:hypothetical protein FIU87_12920 [Bacillus sp. THAF10]|nr:hypothetical protein FIU87_12920 [Bacillus sp. THAF10]